MSERLQKQECQIDDLEKLLTSLEQKLERLYQEGIDASAQEAQKRHEMAERGNEHLQIRQLEHVPYVSVVFCFLLGVSSVMLINMSLGIASNLLCNVKA